MPVPVAAARAMGLPRMHLSTRLVLSDNRHLFGSCGFVETTREAHPGYSAPTSVNDPTAIPLIASASVSFGIT